MNNAAKQSAKMATLLVKQPADKENIRPFLQKKKVVKKAFDPSRVFKDITEEVKLREELETVFDFF